MTTGAAKAKSSSTDSRRPGVEALRRSRVGHQAGAPGQQRPGGAAVQSGGSAPSAAQKRGWGPPEPSSSLPVSGRPAVSREAVDIARRLTRYGGSGTAADAAIIQEQLARMPLVVLRAAEGKGVRVIACRGSVGDFDPETSKIPWPGAPEGRTMADSPTAFRIMKGADRGGEIIIATEHDGRGGRRVVVEQRPGAEPAGFDPVAHELAHAVDRLDLIPSAASEGEAPSESDAFQEAVRASGGHIERTFRRSRTQEYFLHEGALGRRELFAETFARYFGGDPRLAADLPALFNYWQAVDERAGLSAGR